MLNRYSCVVEDALLAQAEQTANVLQQVEALTGNLEDAKKVIDAAAEDNAAYHVMLTNPDMLAAYVNDFFGPEGPYPTETAEETAEREQMEARAQFEAEIEAQAQGRVPQNFQRPEMEMPTPGRQAAAAQDFWGSFSDMMDNSPENAWKYLSQAPGAAFQQKMLVHDL